MASSASLFIEALSNLYIVVTYLCIKGSWSLVNKVVHTVYYLADCIHIGYGRLAHSFLSAIFILLAVPDLLASWLLSWSAPLSLVGAGTGLLALTAVAAQPAPAAGRTRDHVLRSRRGLAIQDCASAARRSWSANPRNCQLRRLRQSAEFRAHVPAMDGHVTGRLS